MTPQIEALEASSTITLLRVICSYKQPFTCRLLRVSLCVNARLRTDKHHMSRRGGKGRSRSHRKHARGDEERNTTKIGFMLEFLEREPDIHESKRVSSNGQLKSSDIESLR
jgi:hypothetical protein